MDRHVYAWNDDGSTVGGYPVLVVDETKVADDGVDPDTHAVTFDDGGDELNSGGIVDTPAVGDIAGDERPEIVVGTNEEYTVDNGTEGPLNVSSTTSPALGALGPTGLLSFANGRVYAIKPEGDPDHATHPVGGDNPYVDGWPVPIGIALSELLPVVGEGINGSPVIAPLTCSSGGAGPKVGTMPAAGLAYVLNADGSSCFGEDGGQDRTLTDGTTSTGVGQTDHPVLPAVGLPAFGDLGLGQPSFVAPAAGIVRALDLALNEYQTGGQDFIAAWDTNTGQMIPGFPGRVNDLSFLTGPAVGDVGGLPGEEVVAGTSSMDLTAFSSTAPGTPTSAAWPKLTTDWTIATPLIGSFGTLDTDPAADAPKVVVDVTRSGYINAYTTDAAACAPASSPRFHHDNANSGDYRRDAVLPGRPSNAAVSGSALSFKAPGDDLLCGTADHYEIVTSNDSIDETNFDSVTPLTGAPAPGAAGAGQTYTIPPEAKRFIAVRAVDEQGNVGRPAVVDLSAIPGGGGTAGGESGKCANSIAGTSGKDLLKGSDSDDRIKGRGGNDRIKGRGGSDCVSGQAGQDRVGGGAGADDVRGGRGKDRLSGGAGDDTIRARRGARDRINCGAGDDVVFANRKRDHIASNCETVHGGS